MKLSHSALRTYMDCPRKFYNAYELGYERPDLPETQAQLLGSAVHHGLAEACTYSRVLDQEQLIAAARRGVSAFMQANTNPNAVVLEPSLGIEVVDEAYYAMVRDVGETAKAIVKYQIPLIGLGTKYVVATQHEVFGNGVDEPTNEFEFSFEIGGNTVRGIIDAILKNTETNTYYITDWKVRRSFDRPDAVGLDGQLYLYAFIVAEMGAIVPLEIMQVQMRNTAPKPAQINKNGTPSMAAQMTTWAVWSQDISNLGMNPEKYRDQIMPKLNTDDDFILVVPLIVNRLTIAEFAANLSSIVDAINANRKDDYFPRVLNSMQCGRCQFWRACATAMSGGNESVILDREYQRKEGYEANEVE